MDSLPTCILVKITSHLHLKDLKSLRSVSRNVQKKSRIFNFWKIYYSQTFEKKIQPGDLILWEDLAKIDYITRRFNVYKNNIILESFNKKLSEANPRLIQIYLKLLGIDILNHQIDPVDYLFHHTQIHAFKDINEIAADKKSRRLFINHAAKILFKTPCKDFSKRLFKLAREIDHVRTFDLYEDIPEDRKSQVMILEKVVYYMFERLRTVFLIHMDEEDTEFYIIEYLSHWRTQLETMLMSEYFDSYYTVETITLHFRKLKEPYNGIVKDFFGRFLKRV